MSFFMSKLFYIGLSVASLVIISLFAEEKIERLTPPIIKAETVFKTVDCTRPMREGRFNISTDLQYNKLIVHCYGHGGSGWTTLFGSVEKALSLFQIHYPDPHLAPPIRVVGSGCMGLTAALELSRRGYVVSGITTKELYEIPSWKAAGYFALVSVKTSPEEQANLNQIGMETFKTYQSIEKGEHPYLTKDAVRYMPVYCSEQTVAGVEELEEIGLIPPREHVTLDFGNGVQHPGFVKYMTYFMDTTNLMKQLTQEVKNQNIPIEVRELQSLKDVQEEIVFNCSGLGGRLLNHDSSLVPVRGHLILLNERSGTEHMNYMIYTKFLQADTEEYVYMFPKKQAVFSGHLENCCRSTLGGTFIPHTDRLSPEELEKLDEIEFQKLLDRNSLFFHGVPFSN